MSQPRVVEFTCEFTGLSYTTQAMMRQVGDSFEARIGIAIFGMSNLSSYQLDLINRNPFDTRFYDNYADGFGSTQAECIENLKASLRDISNGLW